MRTNAKKLLLSGLGAVAVTACLAVPANAASVSPAAEGNFPISVKGCGIEEQIQLQGSPAHDYMRWTTISSSSGCIAEIDDNGSRIEVQSITDGGTHHSNWYYDGPGHSMKVCVTGPTGAVACGRAN